MTGTKINFKQERDFGDLFNATFGFISQEFKRLGTAILYFVVPFLLLSAIAMTIYSVKSQEMVQTMVLGDKPSPFAIFSVMGSLIGYIGIAMALYILAITMLFSTVYSYIKLYVDKGAEGFTINDVWIQVTSNFWALLIASIAISLVVMIGTVFCVLPGIYLAVALSLVFCIMIFEEKKFTDAFKRSMKLINTNWWLAFGVFVIVMIIVYILAILLSIPSMIFGFKSMLSNIKDAQNQMFNLPTGFYIANAITSLFTQVLMVIPITISAFLYYSTVEKVEKPSLMDKIGQIGDNE
ncbi:MAG: hypothetical protein GZ094_03745 [Mariniphaga sp.]|nr:hypothetical protein [Mariniphaga sp.]